MATDFDSVLEQKFKQLLARYPGMTAQGLGVDPSKLGRLTEQKMTKVERQRLEASVDAFKLAINP